MNSSFSDIFYQKKERRPGSLNRNFYSDYIGMDDKPNLKNLVGRRDKIQFAQTVQRYDRKYKVNMLKKFFRLCLCKNEYIFLYFKTILQIGIFSQQGLKQISRDLVVTPKGIFLIGREKQEPKQKGGKPIEAEVVTRKIEFKDLHQVSFKYVHNDLFQNIIR